MTLKEKAKSLPSSPGVYLMKDSIGSIIYVGKSKNLKSRVSSYFQSSKSRSPKVEKLVKNISTFEYILTDTEFEAFLLECELIKGLKPRYNRLMKAPMSYTYIRINLNEAYPGIEVSNVLEQGDGRLYFGPYTNKNTVERAVQGIKEACGIMCSSPSKSKGACLNYSLGLCIGICLGDSKDLYMNIIDRIIALLKGTDKSVLDEMEKKMLTAAERFDFEAAAKYRDYISAVNSLVRSVKVIDFTNENKNICMLEYLDENNVKFFFIKGNKVLFSEKFDLKNIDKLQLIEHLKVKILDSMACNDTTSPVEVSKDELDESHIIWSYLKNNSSNYIIMPEEWFEAGNYNFIDEALVQLFN